MWSRMQLAIGQGTTTVTPLLNLMMYAAIANDGVMMTPYLVDHYLDADGNVVEQTKPKALRSVCTKAEAERHRVDDSSSSCLRHSDRNHYPA